MKRLLIITFSIIFSVFVVGFTAAQINRATCFRNGALPRTIADAEIDIGRQIFRRSESDWTSLGVSEPEIISAIKLLEVNGPAMSFEHASTRYATFEFTVCPEIEMPITLGFHCGEPANLGWIASRCQRSSG